MLLPMKLGIGGGVLFAVSILFGWVTFPIMLKSQVNGAKSLEPGSVMREMWSKLPFPLEFKIYLFNVTNPQGIEKGEKPIVREVGPYFYDEWKEKLNLVDRESDDSVEYNQRITWIFNPAKSNGLTGDEELTLPHIPTIATTMHVYKTKPAGIPIAVKGIDSLYKKPTSVFFKTTAREILFDGIPVDCSGKEFAATAMCAVIRRKTKDFMMISDDQFAFSLFGAKNGSYIEEKMRVYRGKKHPKDVGVVMEWNNQSMQTVWSDDHCNAYNGTDSTIFASFLYKDDDIVSFTPDICRSLSARFQYKTTVKGISCNHYTADLGDQSTIPEEKCFCPSPDTCLKKGAFDLSDCIGSPIIATLPHFYLADESYLEGITGLHPVQEEHEVFVDFEPVTGTPLSARKRLQFNIHVHSIEKYKPMKTFPDVLFPLFWVEEGFELSDDLVGQIKSAFRMVTAVSVIKWLMLLSGLGLVGGGGFLEYKRRQSGSTLEITTVPSVMVDNTQTRDENKKWPLNISTLHAASVPPNLDGN